VRRAFTQGDLDDCAGGVLVPTMGGLHAGHVELVKLAARARDEKGLGPVVVSVFVNPKQFEESVDFERYPRDLDADAAAVEPAGADVVFAPGVDEVYPPGVDTDAPVPPVADGPGLEDEFRPGHLPGVCQVVWRLFELARPAAAVFGEKDWQQLQIARALAASYAEREGGALEIIPAPTVREADGLAMSSRNRFLTPADRARASAISAALARASEFKDAAEAELVMRGTLESRGLEAEYAVVRDAETLMERPVAGAPARALIAARLGEVRLIDNAAWPGAMLRP